MITLIAAIGKNNELGLNNKLLWNIPEDMKHFKDYTSGKVVIMGRKTFESIGSLLPGRKNIIVSSHNFGSTAIAAHSIESALSIEHCYDELVVIGGAAIYKQTIGVADKLVITHVDSSFIADSFFPEIDLSIWAINNTIIRSNNTHNYRFVEYTRSESRRISD